MTPSKFALNLTDRMTYIFIAERKGDKKNISCNVSNVHLAFRTCYMDPELNI
jgi:hypothetical protein